MADQRSSIDLTTLAEVQRLLASTDFATIDDLAHGGGAIDLGDALEHVRSTSSASPSSGTLVESTGMTPLPRRR